MFSERYTLCSLVHFMFATNISVHAKYIFGVLPRLINHRSVKILIVLLSLLVSVEKRAYVFRAINSVPARLCGGCVGARPQRIAWAAGANAPFQFPRIDCCGLQACDPNRQ